MMLSRDFGSWSGVIATGESSDKNSVVLEGKGVADEEFEVERGKMGSELGNGRCRDESEVLGDGAIIVEDEDVPKRAKLEAFDAHVSELLEGELPKSGAAEVKRKARFFQCDSEAELHTSNKKMRLGDGGGGHITRDGYQCATCNKSFQSYQALGGHRASYHKKLKSCSTSGIDVASENNSTETDATIEVEEAVSTKGRVDHCNLGLKNKVEVHECPICHKVFPSGQALGGHKRSHFVMNTDNGGSSSTVFCNLGRKSNMGLKNMDKAHECPICHKVFPSGQALGGHTSRPHLIMSTDNGGSSSTVFPRTIVIQHQNQPPGMPDLIDLNLPAPVDKESTSTDHGNVEFKPW